MSTAMTLIHHVTVSTHAPHPSLFRPATWASSADPFHLIYVNRWLPLPLRVNPKGLVATPMLQKSQQGVLPSSLLTLEHLSSLLFSLFSLPAPSTGWS